MKKLFSLIILSGVGFFGVNAQSNTNAQNILDKAKAKVQASKGINIGFSLTQKDKQNKQILSSKGTLVIKGLKYYLKQGDNEIFCNGEQLWNYDGHSEVTVTKAETGDEELSPQQIITGFNNKDFDIKLVSSAGAGYLLQLTPVDKRKNFTRVALTINKSSNLITKAAITDKANTVTEINFDNISLNATIPDSRFVFDPSKHPGVEVVNQ
ncbi:MAG TPA: outer membrane lipoprotein carrier protein LolA [Parafilimonas sp.]|nr:outer membrane lipoprotein carrier protein LolA [Parafilimonas sp.]